LSHILAHYYTFIALNLGGSHITSLGSLRVLDSAPQKKHKNLDKISLIPRLTFVSLAEVWVEEEEITSGRISLIHAGVVANRLLQNNSSLWMSLKLARFSKSRVYI
jgi:hypothetical protein